MFNQDNFASQNMVLVWAFQSNSKTPKFKLKTPKSHMIAMLKSEFNCMLLH